MHVFQDFSEFVAFVNKDARTADYNPVRFINVETMNMWGQVKSFLITKSKELIKLSDFCQNDDIAPNINQLKKAIRLADASTLVVPLSEYLRINRPIAGNMLNDILHANFENNNDGKLRIYILLYRMKDILNNVQLSPRELNTILFIEEGLDSDYSLTIVQDDLDLSIDGNLIDGFKKYFIYWEQNPDKPIILNTKNAVNYQDIVFSDNVVVIVSAYDLLTQYYGITAALTRELGTEEEWHRLALEYIQVKQLDLAICTLLPASQYSDELFQYWNGYDSFKKWLLWIWARMQSKTEYLRRTAIEAKSVVEFEKKALLGILDYLDDINYENIYAQRKILLNAMKTAVTANTLRAFDQLDPINRMRCLTDRTLEEKCDILNCLAEVADFESAERILKLVFPLAFEYTQHIGFNDNSLEDYFKVYRRCKITNKYEESFANLVNMISQENGEKFWALPARNSIIEELYDNNTVILFVDSLGAEYVSALKSCINEKIYDFYVQFGHSNLPSTTEKNNDFYIGKNHAAPFYDLDTWKHSNCKYPQSLVQELDIIQRLMSNIESLLSDNETVLIASDHGSSRLAVLCRGASFQASESATIYKYGRYCSDSVGDYSGMSGCVRYDEDDKVYWIFANYDHFIQKGAPVCEIHGGASLEEMIVPVICISKRGIRQDSVILTILTSIIKLPIDKKIVVSFKSNQKLSNVFAAVNGQRYPCNFVDSVYSFEQIVMDNKIKYNAKIISDNRIVGEIEYEVKRGMQKSTKFDI